MLFAHGCDYGETGLCIPQALWELLGRPQYGDPITEISSVGIFAQAYPGEILVLQLTGGDDRDNLTGKTVKPNGQCASPCASDSVCVVQISNRTTPYELIGTTGPIKEVWQEFQPAAADPGFSSPPGNTFYIEFASEMIEEDQPFSVTIRRGGASKAEFSGPNYSLKVFSGIVKKPKLFELNAVVNPFSAAYPDRHEIVQHMSDASRELRENNPHQFSQSQPYNLKQRLLDTRDHSVGVEYRVVSVSSRLDAPFNFHYLLNFGTPLGLSLVGDDILLVGSIMDFLWPNEEVKVFGLTYPDFGFMILSHEAPQKMRTAFHELGHAVGLDHWNDEPESFFNVMRDEPPYGGPFEARGISVTSEYPLDTSQAGVYWGGRGEWLAN